jgi:hypothetical protein
MYMCYYLHVFHNYVYEFHVYISLYIYIYTYVYIYVYITEIWWVLRTKSGRKVQKRKV